MNNYMSHFGFSDDRPKYKKGDRFRKDDFELRILGTQEVIADYLTGRKGVAYIVKDNRCKSSYTVPCWYLEKNNERFGYKKV